MSDISVIRLNVAGEWEQTVGKRQDKVVLDKKKQQAHAVDRYNVFIPNRIPVKVSTLEELAALEPPEPSPTEYRHAIAIEDNAVLPLFPSAEPPPIEMVERTIDLLMVMEENKAPMYAERDDGRMDRMMMAGRVLMLAFLGVVYGGIVMAIIYMVTRSRG